MLINAPYVDAYGAIKSAVGRYFPLGLGYIASVLREHGYEVNLVDPEAQSLTNSDMESMIKEWHPELVGLSSATPNFGGATAIAKMVKAITDCPVIIGGVHASALPLDILRNESEIDYVAVGEGEYLMLELVSALGERGAGDAEKILGLAYRNSEGEPVFNGNRPNPANLDEIPHPARDLVDLTLYRPHAHNFRHRRSATILTSRGCPARCSFCGSHVVHGRRFRAHSPEYVLEEIKQLYYQYGVRHILIQDDTFTINRARVERICDLIIESGMKFSWFCFVRANTIDDKLLSKMKAAGCYSVGIGVESGDKEILKDIDKGLTIERIAEGVRLANRKGLKVQAFYIFGHPGETMAQARSTLKAAIALNTYLAFFNIMIPFPGTDIFREHFPAEFTPEDWGNFIAVGTVPILGVSGLSPTEIAGLVREANLRYYLRLSQIIRMVRGIGSFSELWEYTRGAFALARQLMTLGRVRIGASGENG